MSDDKNHKIREKAYHLWESQGRPEGRALDHWVDAERTGDEPAEATTGTPKPRQKNEGEGNRTATRAYDKHVREFVDSGQVEKQAKAAKKAVEGPEREELERAEAAGKASPTRRK